MGSPCAGENVGDMGHFLHRGLVGAVIDLDASMASKAMWTGGWPWHRGKFAKNPAGKAYGGEVVSGVADGLSGELSK